MGRTVITIARQMGSGGDLIGAQLAQAVGVQHIERQILEAAAAAAGVSPETIGEAERVPSVLERMLEYLGQHAGGLDPLGDFSMESAASLALTKDTYRRLIEDVLRKTAEESDCVVVAHGGAVVLRDIPYVFRVFICAPRLTRVQRVQEYEHLSLHEAEQSVQSDDKARADYFQTYYQVNWLNPGLYDLCINSARMSTEAAVEVIRTAHAQAALE